MSFSKNQIDKAGNILRKLSRETDDKEFNAAYASVTEWRALHNSHLKSISRLLKLHTNKVQKDALYSQRLKRIRSIILKLRFEGGPNRAGRLTQMQDISGCRAVLASSSDAQKVVRRLISSRTEHSLVKVQDYIAKPQSTGYRSIHLVYKNNSSKRPHINGTFCEVQVRSRRQHAWATAVELAGFFRNEDLKRGVGDEQWLQFFFLVSCGIAYLENESQPPNAPSSIIELGDQLVDNLKILRPFLWLSGFRSALKNTDISNTTASWYLIRFDSKIPKYFYTDYTFDEFASANAHYVELEQEYKDIAHQHVALVSADSFEGLQLAYPSFFNNSEVFFEVVDEILEKVIAAQK
ncbi:MAG: RelA/SpoT domain-containing protein [Hyphomonas sp.]